MAQASTTVSFIFTSLSTASQGVTGTSCCSPRQAFTHGNIQTFCCFLNPKISLPCFYLHNKDLGFSDEALALVSFEHGGDVLDADLAVVCVDVIVLAVAKEGEQEAVGV